MNDSAPQRGGLLHTVMRARDPGQEHRPASSLELLFDLAFVVAVGFCVEQLHHEEATGHPAIGVLRYAMVFFAIWWAWVNFSHFGSVYDTDDVPYRLLTVLQIGGVLVLAAGVEEAFARTDFTVITIGYVIMRVAMVAQWVRAAVEDPANRRTSLRFATGILVVQVGWVLRLLLPGIAGLIGFLVLVVAEISVPAFAEAAGKTSWHPAHLAERFGLFVLIVLGEQVVSSANAIAAGLREPAHLGVLVLIAASGLVTLVGMWWLYFDGVDHEALTNQVGEALYWSYLHYFILAAIAATGAGIEEVTGRGSPLAVAIPVALFLGALWLLRARRGWRLPVAAVAALAVGFTGIGLPLVALVLAITVGAAVLGNRVTA